MAFKLSLVADVAAWLKGTSDVEKSLDQVSDSLNKLADDSESNAKEAADDLKREFTDAFDKVKKESRDAGRKIGDDVKDGTKRATEGVDDFKDEANQSAREAAASFSGEFDDVGDYIQEVLANALGGFGPVGKAAGIAAAIGIGILISNLQTATDEANETRAAVSDLIKEFTTAEGSSALLSYIDSLRDKLLELPEMNVWEKLTNKIPTAKLDELIAKSEQFGISQSDIAKMLLGDQDAHARVLEQVSAKYLELGQNVDAYGKNNSRAMGDLQGFRQELVDQAGILTTAENAAKKYGDSGLGSVIEGTAKATAASDAFSSALTENLSVADEGLKQFVHKGKLNLQEWADELKRRASETKTIQDFSVTIAPKLSPEALENFAKLPTETQAQIANAYKSGDKGDKKTIVQNLEAEAKVTSVRIDPSGAQTEASKTPIEIPTTVATSGLPKDTQAAANVAQSEANKDSNKIEFNTKIDRDELQRQVNRAAASITSPTITIKTRIQKEVP